MNNSINFNIDNISKYLIIAIIGLIIFYILFKSISSYLTSKHTIILWGDKNGKYCCACD